MKARWDNRIKTKFDDCCSDNSCIMWVTAIFDKLPKYIEKNLPKKWHATIHDVMNYDNIPDDILKQLTGKEKCIICEFEFSWVDDPKKHIQDQIYGMNISGWLTKNHNHKDLVWAMAWNKID